MSNCNNSNQNCGGNNIYVSGSETRTTIEVTNNKSRYYAELAEIYKNKAKEYCDNAKYYAEQNSDVSMNYVNTLEITLRNLIDAKQDAGDYALSSEIPAATSDLTNDSGFITSSALSGYATEIWVGNQGYITGISGSDVTTALDYTPAENDLSNLSATSSPNFDGQWVSADQSIVSQQSVNGSTDLTYDISSLLPNDNYSYEILLMATVATGSTSGNTVSCFIATDIMTNFITIARAITRTSSVVNTTTATNIPVGAGRVIYLGRNTGWDGTVSLTIRGYRRIGTNQ